MAASAQRTKVTHVVPLEIYFRPFNPERNPQLLSDRSCFQRFSSLGTGLLESTRKALPCRNTEFHTGHGGASRRKQTFWGSFFFSFKEKLTQQIFLLLAFQPHALAEASTHLAHCSVTAERSQPHRGTEMEAQGPAAQAPCTPGAHTWQRKITERSHVSHGHPTLHRPFTSPCSKQHP